MIFEVDAEQISQLGFTLMRTLIRAWFVGCDDVQVRLLCQDAEAGSDPVPRVNVESSALDKLLVPPRATRISALRSSICAIDTSILFDSFIRSPRAEFWKLLLSYRYDSKSSHALG
jgi:hypothetical protein